MVANTGCKTPGELETTFNTSEVAVCCSSVCLSSLSNRAFSMAMTAWAAKFFNQFDLLVGKGANFLAVHDDRANQFVIFQHWNRHGTVCPQVRRQQRKRDCVPSSPVALEQFST